MTNTPIEEAVARALMQAMADRPIGDEEWNAALKKNDPAEVETLFHWARTAIEAYRASMPNATRVEELEGALEAIRGMLAGYDGQPNHVGDIFKIADAALGNIS